ncbi:MAG: hypothetical protein COA84_10005 [Robiginitomaculum sp.]|nr:MAG: hypothetical protein COA84_10005 [Robiginitomaculum sp.]
MRRFLLNLLGFTVLALCLGFVVFLIALPKIQTAQDMQKADAIVVLTGGGGTRIRAAATLLAKERGERLLISGVHSAVQRRDIQDLFHLTPKAMQCCVDLGYRAQDTLGNADETAAWAQSHKYGQLIVVTSTYHMPRALIELRASLPAAELLPFPVKDGRHKGLENLRRMVVEYLKYVVILAREAVLSIGKST